MVYTGSCHCGRIRYEVEGTVDAGLACNCSMCARKGSLLWFVPREQLRLLTPEDDAA
ncbi:MAG: glutathione-dependent formaldehyde-activating enzyme family protein, partial [Ramlibacter sp.]|nr:glutathione-dependent formaldehyde-activating enzyme family protein [Ramlibacter sp.]